MPTKKISKNINQKITLKKSAKKKESVMEMICEEPSVLLEKTIDDSKKIISAIENRKSVKKAEAFWHLLGPGLTTGAADDDPSGIATYSQAGARYGFQWLWLAPLTFPLMAVSQEMCARIGLVTGQGLAANIRKHFSKKVLIICTILLFGANTFNIGADLGAMAQATQLLIPKLPFSFLVIAFALVSLLLQIFSTYQRYAHYLKWLAILLLSYVFSALMIHLDWGKIFQATIIPSFTFSKEGILLMTGVLGTTISPYLFFWQTSQEVEEEIMNGKTNIKSRLGASLEEIKEMRVDIWSGMFLSNLVMFFIIAACGATLHVSGITNIATAADAAAALRPLAGDASYFLFALGIIGTGLLAIPVLAGSISYALSESFGWKEGLYRKLDKAQAFYGVIIISILVGLILNFIGLDPIKALVYSAIANGVIAPVILVLIVLMSSDKKLMGNHVNGLFSKIFGWLVVGLMVFAGLATLISIFS